MSPEAVFPPEVFTLWRVALVLAIVVFVPLSVYWLHSLWRTAKSVRVYTQDSLTAARGIGAHTAALPALDATIAVATDILAAAEAVAGKLGTIATVLEQRAGGRG